MIVTLLNADDYNDWLPLWRANMENIVADDVTAGTWARLCDPVAPVYGLCVRERAGGPILGICHYVLHPTTGNLKQVCYMQDLFIDPAHRRKGLAKLLVTTLAAMGKAQGWARVYWLAEGKNEPAQRLYETLGLKLDFTLHVLPL